MRRAVAVILGVTALALAAAVGPSAGAPNAAAACKPGVRVEGKVRIRTFCGKAHATVHVGSRRWSFSGGTCYRGYSGFLLGVGKYTLNGDPKYRSFWVSAPAYRDGTFRKALVQWQVPGTLYVFETPVTLRLTGKLTKGTFKGKVAGVGSGSGSFSCK